MTAPAGKAAASTALDASSAPPHRVALGDGWSLWRAVCLRSAGMPVAWIDDITSPRLSAAERHLAAARGRWRAARTAALEHCRQLLTGGLPPTARAPWRRLQRALVRERISADAARLLPAALAGELAAARAALDAAAAAARAAHADAWRDSVTRLKALVREPLLREALAWQAPALHHTLLPRLAAQDPSDLRGAARARALLVARYLQRYCAKNDSIGFFGPIAWGWIDDAAPRLAVHHGPALVRDQRVRFEHWAVDALAGALAEDGGLRRGLAPRLAPGCLVEGRRLRLPGGRCIDLAPLQARFLAACDGSACAAALAARFAAAPGSGLDSERAVLGLLHQLEASGAIAWRPLLPVTGDAAERLADLVARAPQASATTRAAVVELARRRAEAERARGDAEAVERALAGTARWFERTTGSTAARHPGRTYAGRTPLYVDCRRDVDLTLGGRLVAELAPALTLVLASARWLAAECAERYYAHVDRRLRALLARCGGRAVDLTALWLTLQRDREAVARMVAERADALAARWERLLAIGGDERRVARDAARLREAAREAFPARPLAWAGACHHSPDLMLCARDPQTIARGEYLAVLGELHPTAATSAPSLFASLNDTPERFAEWLAADRAGAELLPVPDGRRRGTRAAYDALAADDLHLEFGTSVSWLERDRVWPIGALLVTRDERGARIVSRCGHLDRPAQAFFGPQLRPLVANAFQLLPARAHVPRVTIDRLVVARERWMATPGDIPGWRASAPHARHLALAGWARAQGLPRRVFVHLPEERKPLLVDLASPLLVEDLARHLRNAADTGHPVAFTEMLPDADGCWLADDHGRRYTAELRLVAVDETARLLPWPGATAPA